MKEKIKDKFLYIFTFILGIITFLTIIYFLNEVGVIHLIDPDWQYYANNPKPDGELYLHVGNQTQTIYLGHEAIITLCRGGYERGYEDYKNITCEERFEGCGAVNCECWVND